MKKILLTAAAALCLWGAPLDDAVKKLALQLEGEVAHRGAQTDKNGVTLKGFSVADEAAVIRAQSIRFEGADVSKKADLLTARRIVMEAGSFNDRNGSVIDFKKLTLEAADLGSFFQVLGSEWGSWQNVVELSKLKLLDIEQIEAVLEPGAPKLALKRFVIDGTRFKGGVLEASRYQLTGLDIPVTLIAYMEGEEAKTGDSLSQTLSDLGYSNLLIDWRDDSSAEGEGMARKLVARQKLAVAKMGELAFELRLSNVPQNTAALFMQEEMTPQESAALMSIKLDSASLTYTDRGLLPKLYARSAAEQKLAPALYAKTQADEFRQSLAQVQRPILSAKEIDALAAFIEKPGTLTLSVRPREGAMLMELTMLYAADWRLLMERLALKVEAVR
ncbi:MAG: hypothetical protein AB7E49_07605 [Campylobacterales bacterium]